MGNDENISIEWKYLTPWIACGVNLIFVITGGFGLYSNSKTATNNIGIITIILNVECVCATPLVIGLCCIDTKGEYCKPKLKLVYQLCITFGIIQELLSMIVIFWNICLCYKNRMSKKKNLNYFNYL